MPDRVENIKDREADQWRDLSRRMNGKLFRRNARRESRIERHDPTKMREAPLCQACEEITNQPGNSRLNYLGAVTPSGFVGCLLERLTSNSMKIIFKLFARFSRSRCASSICFLIASWSLFSAAARPRPMRFLSSDCALLSFSWLAANSRRKRGAPPDRRRYARGRDRL